MCGIHTLIFSTHFTTQPKVHSQALPVNLTWPSFNFPMYMSNCWLFTHWVTRCSPTRWFTSGGKSKKKKTRALVSDPRIDRLNVLVQRWLSSRPVLSETLLTFWHDENEPTPPRLTHGSPDKLQWSFFFFFFCSKPTAAGFHSNDHCFYFNYVHFIVSLQQQLFAFSLNLRPRLKSSELFVIGVCISTAVLLLLSNLHSVRIPAECQFRLSANNRTLFTCIFFFFLPNFEPELISLTYDSLYLAARLWIRFPNKTGSTGGSRSHLPSLILALISPLSSLSTLSSAIYCHTWRGGAPNFSPWLESLPLAQSFSKPSVGLRPRFKTLIAHLITVLIVSDSVLRVPPGLKPAKEDIWKCEWEYLSMETM